MGFAQRVQRARGSLPGRHSSCDSMAFHGASGAGSRPRGIAPRLRSTPYHQSTAPYFSRKRRSRISRTSGPACARATTGTRDPCRMRPSLGCRESRLNHSRFGLATDPPPHTRSVVTPVLGLPQEIHRMPMPGSPPLLGACSNALSSALTDMDR